MGKLKLKVLKVKYFEKSRWILITLFFTKALSIRIIIRFVNEFKFNNYYKNIIIKISV